MESAKLVKATGEPLRALQELENSMRLSGLMEDPDTIDLTSDDDDAELKRMRAKASAFSRSVFLFVLKSDLVPRLFVGSYFAGALDERVRSIRAFATLERIPDRFGTGGDDGERILSSRKVSRSVL